ncbi:cation:proton antiporter [Novispirillum sp. DQ9]|uniref:cation:proton antiporter n=1 Tax=Novispirillum sp. DQ9 TaxID=3398612 RepID=UPI003C7AC937
MSFGNVFIEVSAVLLFAVAVGAVGLVLRQPLIVSFLAAGVLAGPAVLGLVGSTNEVHLLAEFGVALLLFVVGLKLDLGLIRSIGKVALTTGLGQVIFTSVIGFFLCLVMGYTPVASLYIAVALTFSSTIIIVKLLSDKGEIDSLHGRVALGFLIVQDVVVVLVMVVLSSLDVGGGDADGGGGSLALGIAFMVLKAAAMIAALGVFIRWVAEPLMRRLAQSTELIVLFSVAWAVSVASVGDWMGFSKEMGAFLAGVSLATTQYREVVGARLTSLRDFLLLFFFIDMGSRMDLAAIGGQILPAIGLSLFVLIGNPLIVMIIMGVMGYRKRTGFLAGLTVAQISEFSLIFAALGLSLGHITGADAGLVTLVGLITIGLSTYMILYSYPLYRVLEPILGVFERREPFREKVLEGQAAPTEHFDAMVFGLGRFGSNISRGLRQQGWSVLGVDFDPAAVAVQQRQGHPTMFGDAGDPEFVRSLPLDKEQWVVIAMPVRSTDTAGVDPAFALLRTLNEAGYAGRVAVTAQHPSEAAQFHEAGADLVLLPFADAAHYAVEKMVRATHPEGDLRPYPAMSSR